jgi:ribonuclease HI
MKLKLIFDGGNGASKDKMAYGSFKVYNVDRVREGGISRVEFGIGYTNNEAEYLTLIQALTTIKAMYGIGTDLRIDHIDLDIEGDSELIRCQLGTYKQQRIGTAFGEQEDRYIFSWTGWRVKAKHLEPLRDKARGLLEQFNSFTYKHIPRKEVVAALGH